MSPNWLTAGAMFLAVCGALAAVTLLGEWWTNRDRLRRQVWGNLESAWQGGQFDLGGGYLAGADASDIALDLAVYAADMEGVPASKLEPHVRDWMIAKGLKP